MARQLHAQGERVALLAIIEGFAPRRTLIAHGRWRGRALANSLRNLSFWWSDIVDCGPAELAERLRHRGRLAIRQMGKLRAHPESSLQAMLRDEVGDLSRFSEQTLAIMERHLQAALRYTPGVYPGRITLFRVRKQPVLRAHDPAKGWSTLTSQAVDIRIVSGTHLSILEEPSVQDLAAQLRASLDRAR